MEYLRALTEAIRENHDCECAHIDSVPVTENFPAGPSWDGFVEVFRLFRHPQADWVYAWGTRENEVFTCVIILGIPPIHSAREAVRAFLVSRGEI